MGLHDEPHERYLPRKQVKTFLKVLAIIGLIGFAAYLLLHYIFFPVVGVEHLYTYIPDNSSAVIVIETEPLANRIVRELFNSDSPLRSAHEDSISSGLGFILSEGLWHGLDIPESAIAFMPAGSKGEAVVLLPLNDKDDFIAFLRADSAMHHHVEVAPDQFRGSRDVIQVYEDHIRVDIGGEAGLGAAADYSYWVGPLNERDQEAIVSAFFQAEEQRPPTTLTLHSLAGELRIDLHMAGDWPIHSAGQSDGALIDAAIRWDRETITAHPIWWLCQAAGLDERMMCDVLAGDMRLCVQDLHPVVEEFVSYTYDENFEKVNVTEYQERLEASFYMEVGLAGPTDSLFYKNGWVEASKEEALFRRYPFQEVLFEKQPDKIVLRSREQTEPCALQEGEGAFMRMDIPAIEEAWNGNQSDESLKLSTGVKTIRCEPLSSKDGLQLRILFLDERREGLFGLLEATQLQ